MMNTDDRIIEWNVKKWIDPFTFLSKDGYYYRILPDNRVKKINLGKEGLAT